MDNMREVFAASAVLVVLTACGASGAATKHAGGTTTTTQTTAPGTTTTSDAATATTQAPAPASTATQAPATTTRRAAASSTTAVPTTATTPSPATPKAAAGYAPAAKGAYKFDTSGNTSYALGSKAYPAVSTLSVDGASGTRQHSTRNLMNGADGFLIEQVLDYRPDGIAVVSQKLTAKLSGQTSVKNMKPASPTLVIPFNAAPGYHKAFAVTGDGLTGTETVDILRNEQVPVGGTTVTAHVVRTIINFSGSASGTLELTQWFTPSHRLPAKEHLTGQIKAGFFTINTSYDAALQRLTPG